MKKIRQKTGYTLAEVLLTVGILGVLAAVVFVGVQGYLRSMGKLRADGLAKELFVAAQNHLSMAQSQKYLGRTDFGTPETALTAAGEEGVYAFVVADDHTPVTSPTAVLGLMLPPASVEETLRLQGSYIIRYHKDSARVLDVFTWTQAGERYSHVYVQEDYAAFLAARDNYDALADYGSDHAVIGYYGGAAAESTAHGDRLDAPTLTVRNAETLTVTVTDPNYDKENARLKLVLTGATSGVTREIDLSSVSLPSFVERDPANHRFTVTLDDITRPGMHFAQLFCTGASNVMFPGEDVKLRAVAYNNTELTNVAESAQQTANSLFAQGSPVTGGTAHIADIRHLENLSGALSGVNGLFSPVRITTARQTSDLSWKEFFGGAATVTPINGSPAKAGTFLPVDPGVPLTYQGQGHTVAWVTVDATGNAGLFGNLVGGSVSDVKLLNFTISGQASAGALAGTAAGTAVRNVLALHDAEAPQAGVTGKTNAGGLIGVMNAGSVTNSAAALVVRATSGSAGGLLGSLTGGTALTGCYAGGHTDKGNYLTDETNVTGRTAGGLLGSGEGAVLTGCYSTCSVSGGTAAGGLVGSGTGGCTAADCYATGLVAGSGARGAFAGSFDGTAQRCRYFDVINRTAAAQGSTALGAVAGGELPGVTALDESVETYRDFLGSRRDPAAPYDPVLIAYYGGEYALRTVAQLGVTVKPGEWVSAHYGDWPAPETWVVNERP